MSVKPTIEKAAEFERALEGLVVPQTAPLGSAATDAASQSCPFDHETAANWNSPWPGQYEMPHIAALGGEIRAVAQMDEDGAPAQAGTFDPHPSEAARQVRFTQSP